MRDSLPPPASKEPGFWPIVPAFGTIFFVATTISFLAPLLVAIADDLGITLAEAGQLVVVTAIAWAIASPFTGLVTDRLGRRPILVLCLFGMAAMTIAGSFVAVFWVLIVLRLVTGLFGSGAPAGILGTITDIYPPHRRGRAIGWAQSGFNFATLLGVPVIGAIGGLFGWRVSFVVVGVALIGAALFVRFSFPPGRRGGHGAGNPWRAYGHLFGRPGIGILLVSNVCERITFMAVSLYYAAFLIRTYDLNPVTVAPPLALTAAGALIGTIVGGFWADRFPRPLLAASGLVAAGVCGLLTFTVPGFLIFSILAAFGYGLADALSRPAHFSLMLGLTDEHRGAMAGLIAFTNQGGWALGAAIGGFIIGASGFTGLGFLVLISALVAAGLIATLIRHPAGAAPARRA